MSNLIIGNAILFLASLIMVSLGLVKNKKQILLLQTIQIFMMGIGCLFLGSIPAAIINGFSCVRNILAYHDKLNRNSKMVLIALCTSCSLTFNNIGIWGIFPIISSILFVIFIDTKDVSKFKQLEIVSTSLWLAHDIHILAYSAVVFDILTIVTNAVAFTQLKQNRLVKA